MEATERQLSLAVDDPTRERERDELALPISGAITISGRLNIGRDLYRRAPVRVVVTDADGELLATGLATVAGIRFEEHEERGGLHWTERVHRLKLQ
jgi:hypothetical protein